MASKNRKIIPTCVITGAVRTLTMSEFLPVTPSQIVDSALEAAEDSAAILHLHARSPGEGDAAAERLGQRTFRLVAWLSISPQDEIRWKWR